MWFTTSNQSAWVQPRVVMLHMVQYVLLYEQIHWIYLRFTSLQLGNVFHQRKIEQSKRVERSNDDKTKWLPFECRIALHFRRLGTYPSHTYCLCWCYKFLSLLFWTLSSGHLLSKFIENSGFFCAKISCLFVVAVVA